MPQFQQVLKIGFFALLLFSISSISSAGMYTRVAAISADPAVDLFGRNIAVSGNRAVIGAEESAYLFDLSTLEQTAILTNQSGASDDSFGCSVDINGQYVIVGAYTDDHSAFASGSACVFDAATGSRLHKIRNSNSSWGDRFGIDVALHGSTAIVGAQYEDHGGQDTGSAYIFNVSSGIQQNEFYPSDLAKLDNFGSTIEVDADVMMIASPGDRSSSGYTGSVYAYERNGVSWTQIQKIPAPDPQDFGRFGTRIQIQGDTAVIGTNSHEGYVGNQYDSAYVFTRDSMTGLWSQQARLIEPNIASEFASRVAIHDGMIAIGARGEDLPGYSDAGAIYLYEERPAGSWSLKQTILNENPGTDYSFGTSVAFADDGRLLVGTWYDDESSQRKGRVYVYQQGGDIPEPATMIAGLAGLAGIGRYLRQRATR